VNSGLYIIPTPIGNLEDITIRSLEVLKAVDFILCEDTRTSSKLLQRYDIRKPLYPFHQFNEHRSVNYYTERIEKGECAGLISDSGTPAISDPGFLIVRHCIEHNVPVMTLPGAVAFIPALVSSGLPCDRFCFEGFLPPKKGRNKKLHSLQDESRTMVFYESPYRLVKTLLQFAEVFGEERRACVSREISKIHEEHRRGTLQELCQYYATAKPKGEIVLVVEGLSC
jgi:16S rRNA (cytidine1402-2'-O)-methyltransferase